MFQSTLPIRLGLVGGSDAKALDVRDAATRDRLVVIPAILAVVLMVLYVLLRAVVAPLVLTAATVLSAFAALGLGGWASIHVFGFPGLDNSTPLFALLFLIALGVDYTIFLVTRAREETAEHGTGEGMVRAVSATGGVITSAGIVLAAVFCVLGVLPLIVLTQVGTNRRPRYPARHIRCPHAGHPGAVRADRPEVFGGRPARTTAHRNRRTGQRQRSGEGTAGDESWA